MTGLNLEPIDMAVDCCTPIGQGHLATDDAEELARRLKALADPNRLRILSMLVAAPNAEICVCDLTGPLELSQGTVSHHLKVLFNAGLLSRDKRGTNVHYSAVPGALSALAGLIGD